MSSTPSVQRMRSPAHQTSASVLGFLIGNCWRNGVSRDQVDRRWRPTCTRCISISSVVMVVLRDRRSIEAISSVEGDLVM